MSFLKICVYLLILLFVCELLEKPLPGFSLLLVLAGGAACLTVLLQWLRPLTSWFRELSSLGGQEHFGLLLRASLIAFLAENVGDICDDAGRASLKAVVQLAGRCLILLEALPLFGSVTGAFLSLLQG